MTPLPLASPVAIGEIVAGKYRVESVLGTGSMGVVVGARHITLEHTVAIKLLLHHLYGSREESIARFLTEARAAAKIDSDHVARVFDVGTLPDGTPYMVMEYLDGNDLDVEIEREGPLPIVLAVDYILQAADAIAAAHQLGIVHRDLKPANLFLAARGDGLRRVKVLDFGISKISARHGRAQHAREDGSFGTPAFMSPEQIRDPANVDERADVWALGAILYELITGQMAFVGPSVPAVLETVLERDPCPMHVLRRDVPPELEAIVMRCLAKDREARWLDANELARALFAFGPGMTSLSPIPVSMGVSGAPSMEPMIASAALSSARGFVRDAQQTQPDPEEASIGVEAQRVTVRRRNARDAVLLVSSAAFLFATFAIVSWQLNAPKRRAPVAAGVAASVAPSVAAPPPPAASIAPPIVPPNVAASVQSAPNRVQSAPTAPSKKIAPKR